MCIQPALLQFMFSLAFLLVLSFAATQTYSQEGNKLQWKLFLTTLKQPMQCITQYVWYHIKGGVYYCSASKKYQLVTEFLNLELFWWDFLCNPTIFSVMSLISLYELCRIIHFKYMVTFQKLFAGFFQLAYCQAINRGALSLGGTVQHQSYLEEDSDKKGSKAPMRANESLVAPCSMF